MFEENLLFDVRTDLVTDHVKVVSREFGRDSHRKVVHGGWVLRRLEGVGCYNMAGSHLRHDSFVCVCVIWL